MEEINNNIHPFLKFVTRRGEGKEDPIAFRNKVYISYYEKDIELVRTIANKILEKINATIYYFDYAKYPDMEMDEIAYFLKGIQLVVAPITKLYLETQDNNARDVELPFFTNENITILPIIEKEELLDGYTKLFGNLQYLSFENKDETAIGFDDKLELFLKTQLINDEMYELASNSFDKTIFLSYRKIDRKYAIKLMNQIHSDERCYGVGIWYDEFLTLGQDFKNTIYQKLSDSDAFMMLVTPNILSGDNFVKTVEYPTAKDELHKTIIPVVGEETSRESLNKNYQDIPELVNLDKVGEYLANILKVGEDDSKSVEKTFGVGLAYLYGINSERNTRLAAKCIQKAAELEHIPAIKFLANMYQTGNGIAVNYDKALELRKKLLSKLEKELDYSKWDENDVQYYEVALDLLQSYVSARNVNKEYKELIESILDRLNNYQIPEDHPDYIYILRNRFDLYRSMYIFYSKNYKSLKKNYTNEAVTLAKKIIEIDPSYKYKVKAYHSLCVSHMKTFDDNYLSLLKEAFDCYNNALDVDFESVIDDEIKIIAKLTTYFIFPNINELLNSLFVKISRIISENETFKRKYSDYISYASAFAVVSKYQRSLPVSEKEKESLSSILKEGVLERLDLNVYYIALRINALLLLDKGEINYEQYLNEKESVERQQRRFLEQNYIEDKNFESKNALASLLLLKPLDYLIDGKPFKAKKYIDSLDAEKLLKSFPKTIADSLAMLYAFVVYATDAMCGKPEDIDVEDLIDTFGFIGSYAYKTDGIDVSNSLTFFVVIYYRLLISAIIHQDKESITHVLDVFEVFDEELSDEKDILEAKFKTIVNLDLSIGLFGRESNEALNPLVNELLKKSISFLDEKETKNIDIPNIQNFYSSMLSLARLAYYPDYNFDNDVLLKIFEYSRKFIKQNTKIISSPLMDRYVNLAFYISQHTDEQTKNSIISKYSSDINFFLLGEKPIVSNYLITAYCYAGSYFLQAGNFPSAVNIIKQIKNNTGQAFIYRVLKELPSLHGRKYNRGLKEYVPLDIFIKDLMNIVEFNASFENEAIIKQIISAPYHASMDIYNSYGAQGLIELDKALISFINNRPNVFAKTNQYIYQINLVYDAMLLFGEKDSNKEEALNLFNEYVTEFDFYNITDKACILDIDYYSFRCKKFANLLHVQEFQKAIYTFASSPLVFTNPYRYGDREDDSQISRDERFRVFINSVEKCLVTAINDLYTEDYLKRHELIELYLKTIDIKGNKDHPLAENVAHWISYSAYYLTRVNKPEEALESIERFHMYRDSNDMLYYPTIYFALKQLNRLSEAKEVLEQSFVDYENSENKSMYYKYFLLLSEFDDEFRDSIRKIENFNFNCEEGKNYDDVIDSLIHNIEVVKTHCVDKKDYRNALYYLNIVLNIFKKVYSIRKFPKEYSKLYKSLADVYELIGDDEKSYSYYLLSKIRLNNK